MDAGTTTRSCHKWIDWAVSPLGGEEMPAWLRTHLDGCAGCRSERDEALGDLSRLEGLIAGGEVPAPETDAILSSLPTPSWRMRDPRAWLAPSIVVVGLAGASLALLHPFPALLAEGWAPLALLGRPLATVGELARLAVRGAEALSGASGPAASVSPVAARAGLMAILAGAAALLLLVRRLDPATVRRRRGAGA